MTNSTIGRLVVMLKRDETLEVGDSRIRIEPHSRNMFKVIVEAPKSIPINRLRADD